MSVLRAAHQLAGAGLAILLKTGKYSDLKLIVGPQEQEFLLHKNIVCTWSNYIDKECAKPDLDPSVAHAQRPKPFKFGLPPKLRPTGSDLFTLKLPTITDTSAVEIILEFMYGQDYELLKKSTQTNLSVYLIADFLEVPLLKQYMVTEYTRLFQEKQGRWAHIDIVSIIETIIRKEFTREADEFGEARETEQYQVETMQMLNALTNFIELKVLIHTPEFQQMLDNGIIAKVLAVALLKRTWACRTCKTDRMLGSNTKVSCSKCGSVLCDTGGLPKGTGDQGLDKLPKQ